MRRCARPTRPERGCFLRPQFREKLWKRFGAEDQARRALARIVEHVDVLVGNEEDLQKGLGIAEPAGSPKIEARSGRFLGMIDQA